MLPFLAVLSVLCCSQAQIDMPRPNLVPVLARCAVGSWASTIDMGIDVESGLLERVTSMQPSHWWFLHWMTYCYVWASVALTLFR